MLERKERSVMDVFRDIVVNIQEIVESEVRLVKVEVKAEAANTLKTGRPLAAGIVLALYGLGFLLLAVVFALATVVPPWIAAAVVGAVVMASALALISVGINRLQQINKPENTIEGFKENTQWVKNQS